MNTKRITPGNLAKSRFLLLSNIESYLRSQGSFDSELDYYSKTSMFTNEFLNTFNISKQALTILEREGMPFTKIQNFKTYSLPEIKQYFIRSVTWQTPELFEKGVIIERIHPV